VNYPLYRWLMCRAAPTLGSWVVTLAFYEWLLISIYPSLEATWAAAAPGWNKRQGRRRAASGGDPRLTRRDAAR